MSSCADCGRPIAPQVWLCSRCRHLRYGPKARTPRPREDVQLCAVEGCLARAGPDGRCEDHAPKMEGIYRR